MERINLVKYGFVRSPEDDFSDDGNRFTCYKVGKVRVSKLVDRGEAYIAARRDDYSLDYEDYSKLPHYKDLDKLNGISTCNITEQDLIDLYNACVAYDKEYDEAINTVVWPTMEEIMRARRTEINVRQKELEEIKAAFTFEKLAALDSYKARNLVDYIKNMVNAANPNGTDEEYAKRVYKTPYSKSMIKNVDYNCQPRYDYKRCKEILSL